MIDFVPLTTAEAGIFTFAFAYYETSVIPFVVISIVPAGTKPSTFTSADAKFSTSYVPFSVIVFVPTGKTPTGTFTSAFA